MKQHTITNLILDISLLLQKKKNTHGEPEEATAIKKKKMESMLPFPLIFPKN